MTYTRIAGTGSFLPERVLTNADLEKMIDTTDEWIVERTGIKQRHIAADHESSFTMALAAAKQAIGSADIDPQTLDMIIVATCTPDKFLPSTACLVQEQLGLSNIPAFDISVACAGFIYGLSVVDQFIKTHTVKKALLIGAETMSRLLDWKDRSTCILFGDGAGAVVLEASDEQGIISTHLRADGRYKDILYVNNELAGPRVSNANPDMHMEGNEVFKMAVTKLGAIVDETIAANKMQKSDIHWLVPHQANLRIIAATAKRLNMSMEQVILTVQEHGNTSAASIPLALDVGVRSGKIQRGQTLLLEAFGGGLAWGSALLRY